MAWTNFFNSIGFLIYANLSIVHSLSDDVTMSSGLTFEEDATTAIAVIHSFPPPLCPLDQFMCKTNGRDSCLDKKYVCDGYSHCDRDSDELLSVCDNCSAAHLSVCGGKCGSRIYQCDGIRHCEGFDDELVSVCPECATDPSKFICKAGGKDVCLSKAEHQCNGLDDGCEGFDDERVSLCPDCAQDPTKFICQNLGENVCLIR